MNIFAALSRWVFPPEQQPPPSAKLFDDGLAEIARLLAKAEPNTATARITATKGLTAELLLLANPSPGPIHLGW